MSGVPLFKTIFIFPLLLFVCVQLKHLLTRSPFKEDIKAEILDLISYIGKDLTKVFTDLMSPTLIVITVLTTLLLVGLVNIITDLSKVKNCIKFIYEYGRRYQEFLAKKDRNDFDGDHFIWLVKHSDKAQKHLGSFGRLSFKPAYENYYIPNYEIVLNTIPKLRTGQADTYELNTVEECFFRYSGHAEELQSNKLKELKNPVIWFREGVRNLLSLPVYFLQWLGIINQRTTKAVTGNFLFKIFSGFVALLTLISGFITIITGAEKTVEIVQTGFYYLIS